MTAPLSLRELAAIDVGRIKGVGDKRRGALSDPRSVLPSLISRFFLLRSRLSTTWLIAGGTAVGLLRVLSSSSPLWIDGRRPRGVLACRAVIAYFAIYSHPLFCFEVPCPQYAPPSAPRPLTCSSSP